MDEGIELAELELQRAPHPSGGIDAPDFADDVRSVFEVALVIVCQIVDEQVI
jgi:hypothetical protein